MTKPSYPIKKKPNTRHFYFYLDKRLNVFKSGLDLDNVRLSNTIIVPKDAQEIDDEVNLINSGSAKYKKLFYISRKRITSLTQQITTGLMVSLCLIFLLILLRDYNWLEIKKIWATMSSNPSILLSFVWGVVVIFLGLLWGFKKIIYSATLLLKMFYLLIGKNRARVSHTVFLIIFSVTLLPLPIYSLLGFYYPEQVAKYKIDTVEFYIMTLAGAIVLSGLTTFLTMINLQNNQYINIEQEWHVNKRVYGSHLNLDKIPVLYPKRGKNFYTLNPKEYRELIAYQVAQGDRQKVKELLTNWRIKPLVVEQDARIFNSQKFDLPRKLAIGLFRLTASLLGQIVAMISNKQKFLQISVNWLRRQGINRVYWIYQECEAAKAILLTNKPQKKSSKW